MLQRDRTFSDLRSLRCLSRVRASDVPSGRFVCLFVSGDWVRAYSLPSERGCGDGARGGRTGP
eukprot:649035-Prymnesium_polylepis.1